MSLQKLTNKEARINYLLSLDKVTIYDLKQLEPEEKQEFYDIMAQKMNTLKGVERDNFINKVEEITPKSTKNQLWEYNHLKINQAITALVEKYGSMPSKSEIAQETGLSRQTIHKHLKEYTNHPMYLQELEHFKFMTSNVVAKVFQKAMNGNIGAAKLYFNVMGCLNGQNSSALIRNQQNNFIQINGTVLSQEVIKQLDPEQLNNIERILNTVLPESKTIEVDKLKG